MSAPSLIAVPLDTRLNDMEGRIRRTRTRRMRARTVCIVVVERIVTITTTMITTTHRKQDSSEGEKRGGGNTCGESWVSGSNQTISGFASFLNPWSGSLHLSIPITCSFLRIPITKGERNGINAPLPRCLSALSKRFSFHAQRLIPRFWTKQIQG